MLACGTALLTALAVSAVGDLAYSTAQSTAPSRARDAQRSTTRAVLRIDPQPFGYAVRIGNARGFELSLDGIWLALIDREGRPNGQLVRFREVERRDDAWALTTGTVGEHSMRLEIRKRGDDAFRIRLVDRLDVRTSVQELSLAWRVETPGDGEPDCRLPYFVEDRTDIAPDTAWALPCALAHDSGMFGAIEPDMRGVPRRIPSFLTTRTDDKAVSLVHGLGRFSLRAGNLFSLRGNVVPSIDANLVLVHDLRLGAAPDADSAHASIARTQWERRKRDDALPVSMRRQMQAAALRAAKHLVPIGGAQAGRKLYCVADTRSELESKLIATRHDDRRRPLAVALAVFLDALRRGDTARLNAARGVCRLFLAAPSRGGLFRTRARIDARSGSVLWEFDEQGCYSTQDCARLATWLLRWAKIDSELRRECIDRARGLGEFFIRNRQGDGSIPARFDPELDGRRDALWLRSGETITCGLFLLELYRATGDVRFLAAAKDAHDALAGHKNEALDRESVRLLRRPLEHPTPPRTARLVTDGALLAFGLADEVGQRRFRDAGLQWLDQLMPLQQHTSPMFFRKNLRGGLQRSNFDVLWSDPSCTLAAQAFFEGWLVRRDPQLLSRASAALRAPFRLGSAGWGELGQDVPHSPESIVRGLPSVTAWIFEFLERAGDGIVDLDSVHAQSFLDSEIRALTNPAKQQVNFRLESRNDEPTDRYRIRFLGGKGPYTVVCNGRAITNIAPQDLATGVALASARPIALDFRPQPAHARSRDLDIKARLEGVRDSSRIRADVVFEYGAEVDSFPLRVVPNATRGDAATLVTTVLTEELPVIEDLTVRVRVEIDGQTVESERHSLRLGATDVADCADDDERWLAAHASRRAPFPDGTGYGRFVDRDQTMTYRLPVDARALSMRLQLRFAGSGRARAGASGRTIAEFVADRDPGWTESEIVLEDRTLWDQGSIELTFETTDGGSFGIDWLQFEPRGRGTAASTIGRRIVKKTLDRLSIAVLPTVTRDEARYERESIRLSIFADETFRTTVSPTARPTTGSFANWLRALSLQRLRVSGTVDNWRTCAVPQQPQRLDAWMRAAFDAHDLAQRGTGVDLWIVPHTGLPDGTTEADVLTDPKSGKPVLMLPIADGEGTLLPLSRSVRLFLDAFARANFVTSKDCEIFGELSLHGATTNPHRPPPPLGIALHPLGWVPIYRASTRSHVAVQLPPATRGGFVLELPVPGLENRGQIFLEAREPVVGADLGAWRAGGLVGYWTMAGGAARLGVAETKDTVAPRLTPLRADLWRAMLGEPKTVAPLGEQLITSLWGEECWRVTGLRARDPAEFVAPDRPMSFDLELLGRELLAPDSRMRVASQVAGRALVPLTIDGPRGGTGHVARTGKQESSRVLVRMPGQAGSRIQLTWDALDLVDGVRLTGNVLAPKARMRAVLVGDGKRHELPWLDGAAESRAFVFTLPSVARTGAELVLEFEALAADTPPSDLGNLMMWPLTSPHVELNALAERHVAENLIEVSRNDPQRQRTWFGPALALEASQKIEIPLSIPDAPTFLRLCAVTPGAGESAKKPATARLDLRFRDARGATVREIATGIPVHRENPRLLCLDLTPLRGRTGILGVEVRGVDPAPVYLIESSLRYQ